MNERSSYERLLDKYLDGKHRNEKSASQDFSRNYESSKDVSAPRPRSASGRKKTIMEMLQDGEFVAASKQIVSLYSSDTRPVGKNSQKIRASSTDSLKTKMKSTPLATIGPIVAPGCTVEECHSALTGSVAYECQPPKPTRSPSYERYNPTFPKVPSYSIRSEKPPASDKETQFLCSIKNYIPNSKTRTDRNAYDARKKQGLYGSSSMSESKPIYTDPDVKEKSYSSNVTDRINYAPTHCDETDIRYFTPIKTGPEVGIQRKLGKRTEFDGKADQTYDDLKPEVAHYKTKSKSGRQFMENVKYYTDEKKGNDANIKMSTGMKWNNSFAEKSFQNLKVDYVRNNKTHIMPRSVSTESYPSTDEQVTGVQRNPKEYLARNMSEEFTPCKDTYKKERTKPAPVDKYSEYCTAVHDRAPTKLDNRLSNDKQMDQIFNENKNLPSSLRWDERPQKRYKPEKDLLQQMKIKPIKFEVEGKNSSDPKYSVSINLTNKNKNSNKEIQQGDMLVKQNPPEPPPPTQVPPLATLNENSPSFITIVPTTCISPYITGPNIEVLVISICEKIPVKIPPFLLYIAEQLNTTLDSPLSTYSCYKDLSTANNVSNAPDEPATLFTSVSPITSMSPYITGPCQLDSFNDTAKKFYIFGKPSTYENDRLKLQENPSSSECSDSPSCVNKIPIFYRFTDVGFECQMPNPIFNFQKLKRRLAVPLASKEESEMKVNYNNVAIEQSVDALCDNKDTAEDSVPVNCTPTKNMSDANINSLTENKAGAVPVSLFEHNVIIPEPVLNMPLEESFIKIESPLNEVPHLDLKMENGSQPVPICEINYSINKANNIPPYSEMREIVIVSDVIKSGDSLCESEKNSADENTLLPNIRDWGDSNSLPSSQNTNLTEAENVKLENSKPVEPKCTDMNEINYKQKIELLKNYCESLNLAKDKVLQNISSSDLVNENKEIPRSPPSVKNSNYNLQAENKLPEPELTSLFERPVTKHKRKGKISATSSTPMNSEELMHADTVKLNSNNTKNITELFKAANNIKSAYKTLITRVRDTNIRELEDMEDKIENILESNVFVNEADISTTLVREPTKGIKHHHSKFASVKDIDQIDQLYSESNTNTHRKGSYQVAEHNTNMTDVNYSENVEMYPNENKKNIEEKDVHEDLKTSKLTKTQCEKTSVKFVSTERVGAAGDKSCDNSFRSITTDFAENGLGCNNTQAINEVFVTEKKEVINMGAKKIRSKRGSNISFSSKGKNTPTTCNSDLNSDICDSKKKTLVVDHMTMDTDITRTVDFQTISSKSKIFTQFPSFKTIPACLDSTHKLKFEDISNYVMAIISVPSEAYEKKHCFTTRHLSHVVEHEIMGMDIDESNRMLKKIVNCEIKNIPADNKSIKVPLQRSKCKDECSVNEKKLSSNKKSRKVMYRCKEKLPSESDITPCEDKVVEERSAASDCKEEVVAEVKEKEKKIKIKDSSLENNQCIKSPKYDKKKTTSQILAGTKAIREAIVLLSGQNLPVNIDESQGTECNNSTDCSTDKGQTDTKTIIDCAIKKVINVQSELNKTDVKDQDDGIRMLLEMRNKWCGLETRLDGMRFEHKKRERACDEKMLKLAKVKIERIRTKLNNIIRKNDDQNKKIDQMKDIVNCNINKLQSHQDDPKTMNLAVTAN